MPRPRRQADRRRSAHDADHPQRRPLPAGAPGHRPRPVHGHAARRSCATAWRTATSSPRTPSGFDAVAASVEACDPATAAAQSPACRPKRSRRPRTGSPRPSAPMRAARPRHRAPVEGRRERAWRVINLCLATGNIGREGAGCIDDHRPGQRPGRPRARPEVRPAPRPALHRRPGSARARGEGLGHRARRDPAGRATRAVEIMEAIHRGEIKALLSICFNPLVSLPDADYTREALEKLEFFGVIDFFLSETAQSRRRRARRQPAGGGRRRRLQRRGPRHPHPARPSTRPATRAPTARSTASWRAGWARASTSPTRSRARSSRSCARPRAAGIADYYGITYERIDREMGVFWPCPSEDHPGTPRLFEGGQFFHPDGKARFVVTEYRAERRSGRRGVPGLPDHRPGGEPVPLRHPDPAHRAAGRPVSRSRASRSTRGSPSALGIADGDWVTVTTRRGEITLQAMVVRTIRPDTVFIPYHWPGGGARTG